MKMIKDSSIIRLFFKKFKGYRKIFESSLKKWYFKIRKILNKKQTIKFRKSR
jgi:hypothetical protein